MSRLENLEDSFTIIMNSKTSSQKNDPILPPKRKPRPQKDVFQQILEVEVHGVDSKFSPSSQVSSTPVPPLRKKRSLSDLALNISQDESQPQIMGSLPSLVPSASPKSNEKKCIAVDGNGTNGLNLKESESYITSSIPDIRKVSCNGTDFLDNLENDCQCVNKNEGKSDKSEHPHPGPCHDVSFSSPEISDVVGDDLMSNSHFLQHRASVILVSEDLVLPGDKSIASYRKTPHLKKKSYTFTQGDSYLQEVRTRLKDKSKTRSVSNLIRRTFSLRDLRRSNDVPCLPNLLKRYRQKKKFKKKKEASHLPPINEESNLQSTTSHSFASIFISDDDSYLEHCAKTTDLNCSCSSVRFPDTDNLRKSTSSIDVSHTLNVPIHKPSKDFGSKGSLPCIHNAISRKRFLNHLPQEISTVSLNQEALKRAHELLNKSIKSKNEVNKSPTPSKRTSKSNLGYLSEKSLNTETNGSMASSNDFTGSTKSKMGLSEDIFKTIFSPFSRGNMARSKAAPPEQKSFTTTIRDELESDSKKTSNSMPRNGDLSKKSPGKFSLHYLVANRKKRQLIKRHTEPHIIVPPSLPVSNEGTKPRQEEVMQKFLRRYSYDIQALEVIKDVYNETPDDTPNTSLNIWHKSLEDIQKIGKKALWGSDIGYNHAFENIKSYRTPKESQNLDGASPELKPSSSQPSISTGAYDLNYNEERLTKLDLLNSLADTEEEESKESCEVFSFPWNHELASTPKNTLVDGEVLIEECQNASLDLKQNQIVSEDESANKSDMNLDNRNFDSKNYKNKILDHEKQVSSTVPEVTSPELAGEASICRERLNWGRSISDEHLNTSSMSMVRGSSSPISKSEKEVLFVTHSDAADVDTLGKKYEREISSFISSDLSSSSSHNDTDDVDILGKKYEREILSLVSSNVYRGEDHLDAVNVETLGKQYEREILALVSSSIFPKTSAITILAEQYEKEILICALGLTKEPCLQVSSIDDGTNKPDDGFRLHSNKADSHINSSCEGESDSNISLEDLVVRRDKEHHVHIGPISDELKNGDLSIPEMEIEESERNGPKVSQDQSRLPDTSKAREAISDPENTLSLIRGRLKSVFELSYINMKTNAEGLIESPNKDLSQSLPNINSISEPDIERPHLTRAEILILSSRRRNSHRKSVSFDHTAEEKYHKTSCEMHLPPERELVPEPKSSQEVKMEKQPADIKISSKETLERKCTSTPEIEQELNETRSTSPSILKENQNKNASEIAIFINEEALHSVSSTNSLDPNDDFDATNSSKLHGFIFQPLSLMALAANVFFNDKKLEMFSQLMNTAQSIKGFISNTHTIDIDPVLNDKNGARREFEHSLKSLNPESSLQHWYLANQKSFVKNSIDTYPSPLPEDKFKRAYLKLKNNANSPNSPAELSHSPIMMNSNVFHFPYRCNMTDVVKRLENEFYPNSLSRASTPHLDSPPLLSPETSCEENGTIVVKKVVPSPLTSRKFFICSVPNEYTPKVDQEKELEKILETSLENGKPIGHSDASSATISSLECMKKVCDLEDGTSIGQSDASSATISSLECMKKVCDLEDGKPIGHSDASSATISSLESMNKVCDSEDGKPIDQPSASSATISSLEGMNKVCNLEDGKPIDQPDASSATISSLEGMNKVCDLEDGKSIDQPDANSATESSLGSMINVCDTTSTLSERNSSLGSANVSTPSGSNVKDSCTPRGNGDTNIIKEKCSLKCTCREYLQTGEMNARVVSVQQKVDLSPEIILRTWLERQDKMEDRQSPSPVAIPKWIEGKEINSSRLLEAFMKDTSSPGPLQEGPRRKELPQRDEASPRKDEDRTQKDRCIEVYPETLRQRQRNMAPSPSKVDIKNWDPSSCPSSMSTEEGKKFLPSVKALRSQFENGKPGGNLVRTSSNSSSTNSLVLSSLDTSSGFGSLTSSQLTLELASPTTLSSKDSNAVNSLDEAIEPIFRQFKDVDEELKEMMGKPPSTQGWNPRSILKRLYYVPDAPKIHRREAPFVDIEGYLEKLPSGRKKATFWNAWKRRYFVAKDGILYYYQNDQTEKPSIKLSLMGGKIEIMDANMVSLDDGGRESRNAGMLCIDDGKGHYVVVRCPSRQEAERWKEALETHTIDDYSSHYVQPWPRPTNPTLLRDTLVIDIGSCSVRAGVLASQPTLPQLFFPSVVATHRETKTQIWGIEALMPDVRSVSSVSFPIRPSHKISKFSVDLNAVSSLLQKTFSDLKVDPKNYNIQLSVPRVLNPHTQAELLKILFEKFGVKSVNMTHQAILALYAYNATSGVVVDIGERLDVVPVIDGYIVDGGVSRVPYGGYRIMDHLRQFLFQKNISLITEVDSYVIRQVLETICYCAQHYNTEKQRCALNSEKFEKSAPLTEFFPESDQYETFRNITLDFGRFQATEGLFNPEAWGLDHPGLHKLVHKAIQECSMDIRKEMSRSVFLSGGVTQLPGIVDRLTIELDNLTPPAIRPKVHASPYRYHAAYLGACELAESPAFAQSKITKEEWIKQGNSALRKWAL